MLNELVESGRIVPGQLTVKLDATNLAAQLGITPDHIDPDALSISGAFTLRRRGVEAKLVLDDAPTTIDPLLVRSIATGRAWFEEIKAGTSMQKIAARENISQRRVAHLVDLAFLAPDIVQMITDGRQPTSLTTDKLIRANKPSLWIDQRAWLASL
jgi:site-specific DNA recombinase